MKLFEKMEHLMTAAAFAEEGDRRTALEIAAETRSAPPQPRESCTTLPGNLAVNHGE